MTRFTIQPNKFLAKPIQAFYHVRYVGRGQPENPDYLNDLKNTYNSFTEFKLGSAADQLGLVLQDDLPQILEALDLGNITVCVVPRAKADQSYSADQLRFKSTVQAVVRSLNGFQDGTAYMRRHTNTRTTHLPENTPNYTNDGSLPYKGITKATCRLARDVRGKDILLIDDIYTRGVNIDEGAIQSLLDEGAQSVAFYAVGGPRI
jgi:hypothetical protein